MCLVPCFKQHNLKCEKKNIIVCLVYVYMYFFLFFLSDNFLTSTIISLIFIREVHLREMEGKKRKN